MDEPLHPSTLSEILDRTAQLYRSRFLVFFGIASFPIALLVLFAGSVAMLVSWAGTGSQEKPADPSSIALGFVILGSAGLVALTLFLALTALATAAMNYAASRAFFGQSFTIRDSYQAAWGRGWGAIGLYVMQAIAIWVVPFGAWFFLLLLSAAFTALVASFGIGGIFILLEFLVIVGLVVYGFWMAVQLSLAFPAFAVEQSGVWAALRRSFVLAKGTRGRVLLLYLLCVALNWILSMAVMFPMFIVIALIPAANGPQHARTAAVLMAIVLYGSAFVVQALTRPVYSIALMLFYYDQRIRQEGFDIEWMMLKAGLIVPEDQPPTQPLPEAEIPPQPEPIILPEPVTQPEPPALGETP